MLHLTCYFKRTVVNRHVKEAPGSFHHILQFPLHVRGAFSEGQCEWGDNFPYGVRVMLDQAFPVRIEVKLPLKLNMKKKKETR